MTEGLEPLTTMEVPHTTGTHAAKGHVVTSEMQANIIDTHATRYSARDQLLLLGLVVTEVVHGQRVRPAINICNALIQLRVGTQTEHGAEQLLLHDLHVVTGIDH